jgi:hypothetical protein
MYIIVSFTPSSHLVRGQVNLGADLHAGSSTKYSVPARDRALMNHPVVSHCTYFFSKILYLSNPISLYICVRVFLNTFLIGPNTYSFKDSPESQSAFPTVSLNLYTHTLLVLIGRHLTCLPPSCSQSPCSLETSAQSYR